MVEIDSATRSGRRSSAGQAQAEGLSEDEALARLRRDGPNRLPPPEHKTFLRTLIGVLEQPMILLLLICTALYAALGSAMDAGVLGLSIVGVAAISIYQELRTQRVLEALREMASPRSSVVRDGVVRRIASESLVVGDRLIVQEGDRLACDASLVESHALCVDESTLTGESVPVDKAPAGAGHPATILQAGTLVVQGDGRADVIATGLRTALGRIGGAMASITPRRSRLHEELKRLVRFVAFAAALLCLVAATVFAWREGSWTAGVLVGLTLAMSIVPEEFSVVWTVMLALGAWRLSRRHVLTRQPQAIEALGSTTVLCVDKTGTLTCNRMTIAALHDLEAWTVPSPGGPLSARLVALLETAGRASVAEGLEPMDAAVIRLCSEAGLACQTGTLLARDGVAPGRPFVCQVWENVDAAGRLIAVKGAPEAVLARCNESPERLGALAAAAEASAAQGLRVIAVAAERGGAAEADGGWRALGLIGFHDPIRDDVPAAIEECHSAGVRVIMITGDAPATALAIARSAGLIGGSESRVMSGAELDAMNDAHFARAVANVSVFARVTPTQKLRIVQALQALGEVVAMTGDGVNDGPALRAADVGVAMGQRGTDVAREAAALVLLDDRFASLVDAVRAGRRIFANLHKALGYLFAVHVPIVGLSLLPLFGGPVLLLPIHVVLLELIIDPACSLVFEAEPASPSLMRVPPRPVATRLFDAASVVRALILGGAALAAVVLVQVLARAASASDEALRLAGIATIVAGNLAMLRWFRGNARTDRPNRAFHAVVLGACGLLGLVLVAAPLRNAFGFPAVIDGTVLRALLMLAGGPALWSLWKLSSESRLRALAAHR